jgi:4-amino-4-deoxy-L-arabinose transferase-like glycosyltransferase
VPAWNLIHHGFPGNTTLVEADLPWKGINRRTYNVLPGGILYLAAWFAVVPGNTLATRIAMSLWAPVLLVAYFLLIRRLMGNAQTALLAAVLFCLEYTFIIGAALARVDLMTAALGTLALAAYCEIRSRSLAGAVLAGSTLVVFSCLTHPEGVLYATFLIILAVRLDRRSLSLAHFAVAAIPVAICGGLWLGYVAQDPASAISQLRVNRTGWGRLPRSYNPLLAVQREFYKRYLMSIGISTGYAWIPKLVLLLISLGSAAGVLLTRSLRRQTGLQLILLMAVDVLIIQTFFENSKAHTYLIHSETFVCALIAAFAVYAWRLGRWHRFVIVLAVAAFISIHLGGVESRLRADYRDAGFRSALAFLRRKTASHDLVAASSVFWFDCCGSGHNLVDDSEAGLRSGSLPDYFVLDQGRVDFLRKFIRKDPARYEAFQTRLGLFDLIYDHDGYTIYHLRSRIGGNTR